MAKPDRTGRFFPTRRRVLLVGVLLFVIVGMGIGSAAVGVTAEGDHTVSDGDSIQDAVNDSEPGDTIVVEDGTYVEAVTVDVADLSIVAADGHDPVMEGSGELAPALELVADGITVDGFEIRDYDLADASDSVVIDVQGDNANIENTEIRNNHNTDHVVHVEANDVTLSNLTIADNEGLGYQGSGVHLYWMNRNLQILDSEVVRNDGDGLGINGDDSVISNTNVSANAERGIRFDDMNGANVESSTVVDNGDEGIYQSTGGNDANDVNVTNTVIADNGARGIWLSGGSNSQILENTVTGNRGGIAVDDGATIVNNYVGDNEGYGHDVEGGIDAGPHSEIRDNEILDVEDAGITAWEDSIVVNNTVHGADVAFQTDAQSTEDILVERLDIGESTAPNTTLSFDPYAIELRPVETPPEHEDAVRINRFFRADGFGVNAEDAFFNTTVHLEDTDLSDVDVDTLAIYRYNETISEWEQLDSTVDTDAQTVSANITEFNPETTTTFGVFGEASDSPGADVTVTDTEEGAFVEVTNVEVDESIEISLDNSVAMEGAELDTIVVVPGESADFTLDIEVNESERRIPGIPKGIDPIFTVDIDSSLEAGQIESVRLEYATDSTYFDYDPPDLTVLHGFEESWTERETAALFPGDHMDAETAEDLFPGDHMDEAGVDDPDALFPEETIEDAETAADLFPGDHMDAETTEDLFPGDHLEEAGVDDPDLLFPPERIAAAESAAELLPGAEWGEARHVTESPHFSTFVLAGEGGHFEISEFDPTDAEVHPGEEFHVEVVIENAGTADGETDVAVHIDGELAETVVGVHVEAGETTVVAVENVTAPTTAGAYPLTISTDDDVATGTLTVEEAPVFNVDQGTSHLTIQDGVDEAEAGDTLELANETFAEDVWVVVDDLTIEAAEGRPIVDGGFGMMGDNTTVRGLEITGGYEGGPGIQTADHRGNRDLTVENTEIRTTGSSAIYLPDPGEITITDVTIEHTGDGPGIQVTDASDVTIADIAIKHVDHYGITIIDAENVSVENAVIDDVAISHSYRRSIGVQIANADEVAVSGASVDNVSQRGIQITDADSATVSDVAIEGSSVAVEASEVAGPVAVSAVEVDAAGTGVSVDGAEEVVVEDSQVVDGAFGLRINATEAASVGNSVIEGNDVGLQNERNATEIDARYNWWGADDGPGGEKSGNGDPVFGNVLVEPWLDDAPPEGSPVGEVPVYNVDQDSGHATIHNAVSAAESGDTLQLDDRTFEENVTVSGKSLTIEAAEGQPTIDGGFYVWHGELTLRGVEIVEGNEWNSGIFATEYLRSSSPAPSSEYSLTVEDSIITNTEGVGIRVEGGYETTLDNVTVEQTGFSSHDFDSSVHILGAGNVTVIDSEIANSSGMGLDVESAKNVTVVDSSIDGTSHYGIRIQSAWDVDVTSSTVSDVRQTMSDRVSQGIHIQDAGTVTVDDVVLTDIWGGIVVSEIDHLSLSDGSIASQSTAVSVSEVSESVDIEGVDFDFVGNGISVNDVDGEVGIANVELENPSRSSYPYFRGIYIAEVGSVTIEDVKILDSWRGLVIEADSNATITGSMIAGNEIGLLNQDNSTQIDATGNWWGSVEGPAGDFSGDGDPVYGNVLVDPWLDASLDGTPTSDVAFAGIVFDDRPLPVAAQGVTDEDGNLVDGTLTVQILVDGTVVAERDHVAVDDGDFETTIDTTDLKVDVADAGTGEAEIVLETEGDRVGGVGTVDLVHEAYTLDDGYSRWSVPQPAEVYLSNGVLDVTQWDTANATYEDVGFAVNDGSLVTGAADLHRGLYVNADGPEERIGFDFVEPGSAELAPGGSETIGPGWNLLSSNYDISTGNQTLNLDLNTVSSLPANETDYEGDEGMVAHDPGSFVRIGGDEIIGPYDTYWVYVDEGEVIETRAITAAEYDPSQRVAVLEDTDA